MAHRRWSWADRRGASAPIVVAVVALVAVLGMHVLDSRSVASWEPRTLDVSPTDPDLAPLVVDLAPASVPPVPSAFCSSCLAVLVVAIVVGPVARPRTVPTVQCLVSWLDLGPPGAPP